ncbi:pilus assembly protein TadG-related protein [Streptomyces sp. NBC_00287]|uniref:pilus assembly protein TadG-related protein n=1 Tax=Streptomyces sp. NBC_00287 TaxID=2975702 RepID=UPI002E285B18|nr:pilus assembly protein TadG-related protein [Streptomyces sp. NBC_00287]
MNWLRLCVSDQRRTAERDDGQVTVFVVVIAVAVLMFAGLVLDGGMALAARVRAIGEAEEAARRGAQAIDVEAYRADGTLRLAPGQARTLAQGYLATTGDSGIVTVAEDAVSVTVTAHHETQLLDLFGIQTLTVTGVGSAHPVLGITSPEP